MDAEDFPANRKTEPPVEKKVEKVVTGPVSRRKTSLGRRLRELFVGGDASSVGSFVLLDVLVPAFKDVVADAVSQGIERMLFGEARSTSRRTGQRPSSTAPYVNYNRPSSPPWSRNQPQREDRYQPSRRERANHNFDGIVLNTRHEAEEVIDRLFDLVSRYQQATVADLYNLVGVEAQFTDEKWGWTDIRGAGVTRISGGYLLDLPRPDQLD